MTQDANGVPGRWSELKWPLLAGAIVAVGLALRIWKAWTGQFSPNSDFGMVALAAKHMAEGKEFAVFFYGQPYMGNVEPVITAFFCRVLGLEASGFMLNLATGVVGVLLLPLVYLWARDAAGSRRAGVMAMLFCLVGSDTNFHYSVAARCAYMATMVCGIFVVWLAARIARMLKLGKQPGFGLYAAMGLAAGVGWWGSQFVIFFYAAAAVVLLAAFDWSMIRRGLLPAVATFLAGSLPWWLWNLSHQWETFDFSGSFGRMTVSAGLFSVGRYLLVLVELSSLADWWNDVRLALMLAALVVFLVLLVRDKIRRENSDSFYFRLAAPVLVLLVILISCRSRYMLTEGVSRYLLPAFPALAVMLAVGCDWLQRKWRFPLGWIAMLLLVPKHIYELPRMGKDLPNDKAQWAIAAKLADELGPRAGGICIGSYMYHWMNFASGERLCVVTLPKERYAPYARRAELAENPAFLADYRGIRAFLEHTGGGSIHEMFCGIPVDYKLTPPPNDWRYMDPTNITTVEDADGKPCDGVLWDGVLDTRWSGTAGPTNLATLSFGFSRQVPLCGIRILSPDDHYASLIMVEARGQDAGPWELILPMTKMTGCFWSGDHVMLEGVQFFQELRFAGLTGGTSRVRLTFQGTERLQAVHPGEILFMEKAPPPEGEFPSVDACVAALRSRGVKQFYGPRWMADRVALAVGNEIDVLVPSLIKRRVLDVPIHDSARPHPVVVREDTGFLMDSRNVKRSGMILNKVGLEYKEMPLGCYTLLVVSKPDSGKDAARYPTLYWTEQGCFAVDAVRYARQRAHVLYDQAVAAGKSGNRAAALQLFQDAVRVYPAHQPARRALIAALEAGGQSQEAATNAAVLKEQIVPEIPAAIRFQGGIEFLGLTLSSREAAPTGSIDIAYFWKYPPAAVKTRPRVFMHFLQGKKIGFQDDHDLLAEIDSADLKAQPFDEVLVERRSVAVPGEISPGEYGISIGLYHTRDNTRIRPKTGLPVKRREVQLPVVLKVGR